jgi:glycopeptide antibiotics resistance protein
LIPFKEMFRYRIGSNLFFRNVVGNMIIFMPFGYFVSHFLTLKKSRSCILLTVIASATIENTQLAIGRVFDIDDTSLKTYIA